MYNCVATMETVWLFLRQLQIELLSDPAVSLLSMLWTECLCPHIEALTPNMIVFGDEAFERVTMAK